MDVSIIIPAYNAATKIGLCLEALKQQHIRNDLDYEIIVVDDGSTDQTTEIASSFEGCRVLSQKNQGPAAARNLGAQASQGAILLFTDADCIPQLDWLEKMLAPFQDPQLAGVKGAYLSRQKELVARFVQLEYEDKYGRMAGFEYIDFIDTYSAGFRREIFQQLGGYDVSFTAACVEDQEFSFRVAKAGYKMKFIPEAKVFHTHAASLGHYFRKKFNIGFWKIKLLLSLPEKMYTDSHTPQTLKIQMILVFLLLISLCILPWCAYPLLLSGLFFMLLVLPFSLKYIKRDWQIAFLAPFLLFIRGLALGLGLLAGLVQQVRRKLSI